MTFGKLLAAAAAMALVVPAGASARMQDAHETLVLHLAADGLSLSDPESGDTFAVAFDTDQGQAIQDVAKALGDPESTETNGDCGAGPLTIASFQGDLQLLFSDEGKFVGWTAGEEAGWSTPEGIHVGSTFSELQHAFAPNLDVSTDTLGPEFTTEAGLGGFLTGTEAEDTVNGLYAGTTCFFR